jgi:hypothetical protein
MFLFEPAAATPCGSFSCWADAASKVAAVAGVLVGGAWTVWLYFEARKSEAKTAAIAAKQPFLSKRLDLYSEATSCAAAIAVGEDKAEIAAAKEKFWDLYWGPMALVEDRQVESAMVAFGRALGNPDQRDLLKLSALQLAHSCRDSLAESWQVVLSDSDVQSKLGSV